MNQCLYRHIGVKFAIFGCVIVLFSGMTVFVQVQKLGRAYLQGEQLRRHTAVMQGNANSPYQYRILSEYLVEGVILFLHDVGASQPEMDAFIGFRVVQNILLFALAAFYYRLLGLRPYHILIGLSLLAWGMTHALYDSDLAFNTYFDVVFYLFAAVAILLQKAAWILPITALAALNRETSGLIPFMLLAAYYPQVKQTSSRKVLFITAGAIMLYISVFISLRHLFGVRPLAIPYGQHPGLELFAYNILRLSTWVELFTTLGLLPALAIYSIRRWPFPLKAFFWTIAPLWVVIYFFGSVVAETRLFLVPLALIFVPGTLFGLGEYPPAEPMPGVQ